MIKHTPPIVLGQRIDNYLFTTLKKIPHPLIYRLLRQGHIRCNGKRIPPHYRLSSSDEITLPRLSRPEVAQVKSLPVWQPEILYEDNALIAINKPSGIAVHGGSGLSWGIIEQLRQRYRYLELVHRLDKGTSGVLLLAKTRSALRSLHTQLRDQTIEKSYFAIVQGRWPKSLTQISAPLFKRQCPKIGNFVYVSPHGKPAETHFSIVKYFGNAATLLKITPKTGRTHQIRVHTHTTGYPILGDDRYGKVPAPRLLLHAAQIRFLHPKTDLPITIEASLGSDWRALYA